MFMISQMQKKRIHGGLTLVRRQEERAGYLFILPNILGIGIFVAMPILLSMFLGFTRWNPMQGIAGIRLVGLDNFFALFQDERVILSLRNNLIYSFTYVPITIGLALLLAGLLNRYVFAKIPLRMMCFMPYVSAMVSVAFVWMILFYPDFGPINNILIKVFGVTDPPRWFVSSRWALTAIIIMSVWHDVGYYMIILVSGMQNISRDLYEAANIDGAGGIRSFIRITIPMLIPTLFFCTILATINSFKIFDQVNVITEGGPGYSTSVLVYSMYFYAFKQQNMGYASSIAWVLFIIIFVLSMLQLRLRKKLAA
jgi:ABC-type sugar transport system permease subunit